jgi:hypothetical protein
LIVTLPVIAVPEKVKETVRGVVVVVAPLLVNFCVVPELFTIPPWIVRAFLFVSISKELAPESKLMPAAVMALPSVTVPPPEPRKCATLLFVQGVLTNEVDEELHEEGPEVVAVVHVPPPAVAGLAILPAQNNGGRLWLQTFGSTFKNIRVVISPARMPRGFLID